MKLARHVRYAALIAALSLAACESSEERAEEHFQSALQLLEQDDATRAAVEFRNVFKLNPDHVEARKAYAHLALQRGNIPEAYTNYLRVVELQPDNVESRLALTEMAMLRRDWEEAERHGAVVIEAQATGPEVEIIDLGLKFRAAVQDENEPLMLELRRRAESLYEEVPDSEILQKLLIDAYTRDGEFDKALDIVGDGLERNPEDQEMNILRLQLLAVKKDADGFEAQLRDMIERFPEDDQIKQTLVAHLTEQGMTERAEAFLRDLVAEAKESDTDVEPRVMALAAYVRQIKGIEAAIAVLDELAPSEPIYDALRASLKFDNGDRDDAVEQMQAAVDAEGESERAPRMKILLARMLEGTGNETGARALVDEVLAADPGNADALKMQAAWRIAEDRTDDAISLLRTVLDQAPEDAQAMTLMAEAHARKGDAELALDFLSLAVEASNAGRDESARFAAALVGEGRFRPAEDVLIQALRRTPDDLGLLQQLGEVYLRLEDFSRATGVENKLRRLDTPQSTTMADNLKVAILSMQAGRDAAVSFLEDLASGADATLGAKVNLLKARLSEGNADAARTMAEEMLAEDPENPGLKLILASTEVALQEYEAAESLFREVIDETGGNPDLWLQLVRVVSSQGRSEDGMKLVDDGLERFPDSPQLLWAKASYLEQLNDIDGAIEIYSGLYAQNSQSLIVANNLASLLATYRDDDASLERAWTVARRLRGTDFAPFQDTYGWIAFRRGEIEEALEYLEPAAKGVPDDPIVQIHFGRALEAAGRSDEALEAYRRAVEIAGDEDTRPLLEEARSRLERLAASDGAGDESSPTTTSDEEPSGDGQ